MAELEEALSTRLIHRTSRSFILTELGRDFYEHARAALIEAEAAEAIVRRRQAEPSGTVRISASVPVAQLDLAAHLPRLARTYPKVRVELDVTDRFVDVQQEGVDIAVRSHFAPLPDSGLVQRQLSVEPIILVAAPGYVEQHGMPQSPADLRQHRAVSLRSITTGALTPFEFAKDGQVQQVEVATSLSVTGTESFRDAVLLGLGLAQMPVFHIARDLAEGRLVRVLEDHPLPPAPVSILYPRSRQLSPRVRLFIDWIVERFAGRA